jgi:hypothetical protein
MQRTVQLNVTFLVLAKHLSKYVSETYTPGKTSFENRVLIRGPP